MREQIRKRFLCLMMLAFVILIEHFINVTVSADQVVSKKEAIGSASFAGDEIMTQRQAILAGALGLNVSELVSQGGAAPLIFGDNIITSDGYVICGITDSKGTNEGACGIPWHVGYGLLEG